MHRHDAVQTYRTSRPKATPRAFLGEPTSESQQGEPRSAVLRVEALTQLIHGVSAGLMGLTPEDWTTLRQTESMQALLAAVAELRTTTAAMSSGDDITAAPASCLVATMEVVLRQYRPRLQFLAVNLRLSDLGARELLAEILHFDRWQAAHLQRCQECGGGR